MTSNKGISHSHSASVAQRSSWKTFLLFAFLVLCSVVFASLGIWQVQRLSWKLDLIAAVDTRAHGNPVPIPAVDTWSEVDIEELEYQRVMLSGEYDHDAEVQTLAVTELGSGYWVMTPLLLKDAGAVLINRGFVPQELKEPEARSVPPPSGQATVTGLIRASEPEGGFLRSNDPDNDRWFSRDTAAIGVAQNLSPPVAPFFVDAGSPRSSAIDEMLLATDEDISYPQEGMTVISFHNSHRVYALTWFVLALMSCFGIYLVIREKSSSTSAE